MNFHIHQAYRVERLVTFASTFTNVEDADIVFNWIDSIFSNYNGRFVGVEFSCESLA
jgi:hypothetical protein